jgi:hypothetical protein
MTEGHFFFFFFGGGCEIQAGLDWIKRADGATLRKLTMQFQGQKSVSWWNKWVFVLKNECWEAVVVVGGRFDMANQEFGGG